MTLVPFINLVKRAARSKYPVLLMHNRMITQCYTVEEDSDFGMHYVLHIPDTEDYCGEIYDSTLLIEPAEIIALYKEGHELLLKEKKKRSAKVKEVREEFDFVVKDDSAAIKMHFIVQDELLHTATLNLRYPVNPAWAEVERVVNSYDKLLNYIKVGGYGVAFDGIRYGLYDRAKQSSRIVYYPILLGGKKIQIPICKSMLGIGACDEFFVSVQETNLPSIYIYTVQLEKKMLIEQWIGYIIAF